jgi:hypothetical protein
VLGFSSVVIFRPTGIKDLGEFALKQRKHEDFDMGQATLLRAKAAERR